MSTPVAILACVLPFVKGTQINTTDITILYDPWVYIYHTLCYNIEVNTGNTQGT